MSENLDVNEPQVGGDVNPLIDEHAPRRARSVASDSAEELHAPNVESGKVPVRPAPARRSGATPRARRMSLSLTRVDAWSVAKVTFLMSIAFAIIQVVAALVVWLLLDMVGVFDQVTSIVSSTGLDAGGFDMKNVLSITTVVSGATIFSVIEVVVFTILATILALIYNVVSTLVGGIHVTLGDD